MDPANPESFNHCRAHLSTRRTYHFVDQKPAVYNEQTVTLLCVHGFPDLWYGWRHQIRPWVECGYRVVVPDMLGYGETDMPTETFHYSTRRLCDDLAALLDHIDVKKAVVIGHDWGSFIAARFSLWHPDRLLALAMVSFPYIPPMKDYVSLDDIVKLFPKFGYQLYLASEHSTAEIEEHLLLFFKLLYRAADPPRFPVLEPERLRNLLLKLDPSQVDEGLLNEEEMSYYISKFERGMLGPLSYYRTTKIRFEEEQDEAAPLPAIPPVGMPVMFIGGMDDKTCQQASLDICRAVLPNLNLVLLERKGHWLMLEAPEVVTNEIASWLNESVLAKEKATL